MLNHAPLMDLPRWTIYNYSGRSLPVVKLHTDCILESTVIQSVLVIAIYKSSGFNKVLRVAVVLHPCLNNLYESLRSVCPPMEISSKSSKDYSIAP
ncbi:hypothetical protein J6590_018290 [Homalodisca vitripennis]|nr:hypothetical protein J6590_018290 [Homalodisca vitripennis]